MRSAISRTFSSISELGTSTSRVSVIIPASPFSFRFSCRRGYGVCGLVLSLPLHPLAYQNPKNPTLPSVGTARTPLVLAGFRIHEEPRFDRDYPRSEERRV